MVYTRMRHRPLASRKSEESAADRSSIAMANARHYRLRHADLPTRTRPLRHHEVPTCGRSGIQLPAISLGLWQNFGDDRSIDSQRAIVRRAFDPRRHALRPRHNYGPPTAAPRPTSDDSARRLRGLRDELIISTKAGWDMWPGPYGDLGRASTCSPVSDQRLKAWASTTSTIFYHHHFDRRTHGESLGALDSAVRQGKALYVGISSYSDERTLQADRDPARSRYAAPHSPAVVRC